MQSWLEQARILSFLTIQDCAEALYQTESAYITRESNPGTLTLNELHVLMSLFNEEANQLVWSALHDLCR